MRGVLGAAALTVAVVACGGDGGPGATQPGGSGSIQGPGGSSAELSLPPIVGGGGSGTGSVRIVNLYAIGGKTQDVVLYETLPPAAGQQPIVTVPYGSVSGYVPVSAQRGALLVAADQIGKVPYHSISVSPDASEQDTIVFAGALYQGQPGINSVTVRESDAGQFGEPFPTASAGQPVIDVWPGAINGLEEDEPSYFYGLPGKGCLTNLEGDQDGFGGNVPNAYVAPAGSFELVAWPDGCDGTVGIGPVTVDVSGGRVLVLPYGKAIDALTMLVLPVPRVP